MNSSSGLGQPGPGQPEFDRPASDPSWTGSVPPARFGSPSGYPQPQHTASQPAAPVPPPYASATSPQQGRPPQQATPPGPWGPPSLVPSGPPAGPPPRRTGVRAMLAGGTLVVVVALGLLAWQLLPGAPVSAPTPSIQPVSAAPSPVPAEPTVVRTPEAPRPTTSAQVTGGGIGEPVRFTTADGEARVTVTRATWADNGALAPAPGAAYLVVDVVFEGISGTVTTGGFFTAVREPSGVRHLMTVGAHLDSRLAMRTIRAGQDNTGQVAFEVARGPVAFEVLDERLEPVASVDVPG